MVLDQTRHGVLLKIGQLQAKRPGIAGNFLLKKMSNRTHKVNRQLLTAFQ